MLNFIQLINNFLLNLFFIVINVQNLSTLIVDLFQSSKYILNKDNQRILLVIIILYVSKISKMQSLLIV